MKHELKIKREYFAAVYFGEKTFEIRNNADRNFQVGDTLLLKVWDGEFTGDFVEKVVSYITDFEQQPGYVVLGLVNRHEYELLEKFHRTGVAIERAISTGSVLADHPLKSRLELLANHHKRERALADGMVAMAGRCTLLADLLREARNPLITAMDASSKDESAAIEDLIDCIEAALAGQLPGAWLPIETAPHDGRKALVYRPLAENSGDERIAVKRLTGSRSNHCWDKTVPPGETPCNPTDGACHVTHWMPLPDEPAQQGGEQCDSASPSSSPD